MPDQVSVLFVCLGNICRSTMAEGVFQSLVKRGPYNGLVDKIDSCGTGELLQTPTNIQAFLEYPARS